MPTGTAICRVPGLCSDGIGARGHALFTAKQAGPKQLPALPNAARRGRPHSTHQRGRRIPGRPSGHCRLPRPKLHSDAFGARRRAPRPSHWQGSSGCLLCPRQPDRASHTANRMLGRTCWHRHLPSARAPQQRRLRRPTHSTARCPAYPAPADPRRPTGDPAALARRLKPSPTR